MDRAKVVVHMYTSIDGKIDGEYSSEPGNQISSKFYQDELFKISNANANGATTVAMYAATGEPDLTNFETTGMDYSDWIPDIQAETWDIGFDRKGRMGWEKNYFEYGGKKSHAIEVVTKQASLQYLAFLQSMEIPYLVCGAEDLDLEQALVKLKKYFGLETISLCGGSVINGAFLNAGLVDEISNVITPFVSGDSHQKSLFDTFGKFNKQKFDIKTVEKLDNGGLHLVYAKEK